MKEHVQRRDFLKAASVGIVPLVVQPAQELAAAASEGETDPSGRAVAVPLILINQGGPLPITGEVTTGSVGPATLFVSGSVWARKQDTRIGIEVALDGVTVGTAQIYSNAPDTHRSVIPIYIPISLDKPWTFDPPRPPTYTITLQPMNPDTLSDVNDHFQVVLFD